MGSDVPCGCGGRCVEVWQVVAGAYPLPIPHKRVCLNVIRICHTGK